MPLRHLRRLLVIPAVGLVLVGAPAFAADRPTPPAPTTTEVPMVAALDADAVGDGSSAWTAQADVSANIVGVEWYGDLGTKFTVEIRDGNGEWQAAGTVGAVDVAPDPGSADARSAAGRGAPL